MNGFNIDAKGPILWVGRLAALLAAGAVGNVSPSVLHETSTLNAEQVLVRIERSIDKLVGSIDEDRDRFRELQRGQNELLREMIKHHYGN